MKCRALVSFTGSLEPGSLAVFPWIPHRDCRSRQKTWPVLASLGGSQGPGTLKVLGCSSWELQGKVANQQRPGKLCYNADNQELTTTGQGKHSGRFQVRGHISPDAENNLIESPDAENNHYQNTARRRTRLMHRQAKYMPRALSWRWGRQSFPPQQQQHEWSHLPAFPSLYLPSAGLTNTVVAS